MLRSLARRGGIVLAASVLPMLFVTTTATAAAKTSSQAKLASATLDGGGSTFQLGFNQVSIDGFKRQQKAVTINYQGNGSGAGRTDFANGVVDFAGTDAPYEASDEQPPHPFFYFPTVVAPITVSYNLGEVKLRLSPQTAAKIFSGAVTKWNADPIKADNPKAKLPNTDITVVHRSDSSGTTANFTRWLAGAAPADWMLGSGSTVSWPEGTQGATGNSGVAKLVQDTDGAVGYVDFSDARASDLTYASIENAAGRFVTPSLESAAAAAQAATIKPDLTYDPINSDGAAAYPITSPTWIVVYREQPGAAKGKAIKGLLRYIYGEGQELAPSVDYAGLPPDLLKLAQAQVEQITVAGS